MSNKFTVYECDVSNYQTKWFIEKLLPIQAFWTNSILIALSSNFLLFFKYIVSYNMPISSRLISKLLYVSVCLYEFLAVYVQNTVNCD